MANGSDNRISTFSSSDALNGEANLTFDGSTLTVTGNAIISTSLDITGSTGIILENDETITNSTDGTVLISGDVASGTHIFKSNGDNDVILKTGNSTTGSITITDGANGNIAITPNGTGEVDISKVDIDSGTIDNTVIGATTPVAGNFTTVIATTSLDVSGATGIILEKLFPDITVPHVLSPKEIADPATP